MTRDQILNDVYSRLTSLFGGVGHQACASSLRRFTCLGFAREVASVNLLALDANASPPSAGRLVERNATIDGRGSLPTGVVLHILRVRGDSKVVAPAIQSVTVDVVTLATIIVPGQAKQLSMQVHRGSMPVSIVAPGCIPVVKMPPPLSGPLSINCVNNGVSSDVATASVERDVSRQSVCTENGRDRGALGFGLTTPGAVDTLSGSARQSVERLTTGRAGTLYGHRASSGAAPRAGNDGFGAHLRCQNYTTLLRVEAT